MWQFVFGTDAAFATLEAQTRRGCVRFQDQEMPQGASPTRATVGFELDAESDDVRLLVERGISYSGPNDEIRGWFRSGQRVFGNFAQLRLWLGTTLRNAMVAPATAAAPATVAAPKRPGDRGPVDAREQELDLEDLDATLVRIAQRQGRWRGDLPS